MDMLAQGILALTWEPSSKSRSTDSTLVGEMDRLKMD